MEPTRAEGTCARQGAVETRTTRRDGSWKTFGAGGFACLTTTGETRHVNPWAVVTAHPDGDHEVGSGTANAV